MSWSRARTNAGFVQAIAARSPYPPQFDTPATMSESTGVVAAITLPVGIPLFDDFLGQGSHPNLIAAVPDADRIPATLRGGVAEEKMERRCFARHVPSVLPVGLSIRSRGNPLYCDQVSDRLIACLQVLPQAANRTLRRRHDLKI